MRFEYSAVKTKDFQKSLEGEGIGSTLGVDLSGPPPPSDGRKHILDPSHEAGQFKPTDT